MPIDTDADSTTTTNFRSRRLTRNGDNAVDKVIGFIERYKMIGALLWTLLGYGIKMMVAKVDGMESRITALETNSTKQSAQLDKITRSNCLDRTLYEQALINMECPVNMHKTPAVP